MTEEKERARAVWDTGDYAPFGLQLEPASVALVAALGVGEGDSVLDVAAGNGNLALAAARRGANVVATDFSNAMVDNGRARTREAELEIEWRPADAEDLPFPDDGFDFVTSVFGVMFAGDQSRAAAELYRTARPGGIVALAAWSPDGVVGEMFAAMDSFIPAEPGEPDPLLWGTEEGINTLFPEGDVGFATKNVTFSYRSWEELRATHEAHGVWVVLKSNMPPDRYAALTVAVEEVLQKYNTASNKAVSYDAAYLETLVRKPA